MGSEAIIALPLREDAPFDVVGLGVNVINHLFLVARFPEPDTKVDPLAVTQQGGGVVATALVACARLGLRTKYVGKVGSDDPGKISRQSLAGEGVDVVDLVVDPQENTRVTFGLIEETSGRRTLIRGAPSRRPSGPGSAGFPRMACLRPDEVPAAAVTAGRVLHLDGYEGPAAVRAARIAREARIPVSVDAEEATECREELFALTDVLIISRALGERLTGCRQVPAILDRLEQIGPSVVGVTLAAEGAVVRHRSTTVHVPGFKVDVVDTTGAGDVFHGAFLAGIVWGWPLLETVRLANAVAALKCRKLGGRAGIPSLAETRAFVRATGPDLPPLPTHGEEPGR
jgi:sugar/nucleoside kinase (ribokinase family)